MMTKAGLDSCLSIKQIRRRIYTDGNSGFGGSGEGMKEDG